MAAKFVWPDAWPLSGDRVSCLFDVPWYAGLVKSVSNSKKTMRVWFDDKTKNTIKLEDDTIWKIIERCKKVCVCVHRSHVRMFYSYRLCMRVCSGKQKMIRRTTRKRSLRRSKLVAVWLQQGIRDCRSRRPRK